MIFTYVYSIMFMSMDPILMFFPETTGRTLYSHSEVELKKKFCLYISLTK